MSRSPLPGEPPAAPTTPLGQKGKGLFAGLPLRALTGVALAVGAGLLVGLTPLWALAAVVALISLLAVWEYQRLVLGPGLCYDAQVAMLLALGPPLAALKGPAAMAAALVLALAALAFAALIFNQELAAARDSLVQRGWGLVYIPGCLGSVVLLAALPSGRPLVYLLLISVVAADLGGYFGGSLWGRRRLAPRLSPGKTWEGVAVGLALAAGLGGIFCLFWLPDTRFWQGIILALVMGAISVLGDLLESALKRAGGAKDSGSLLPGHGGALDRIDGIMLAAPALLLGRILWW